jgi:hypothetical protein
MKEELERTKEMSLLSIVVGNETITVENSIKDLMAQEMNKWTKVSECYWGSSITEEGWFCVSKRRERLVLSEDITSIKEL